MSSIQAWIIAVLIILVAVAIVDCLGRLALMQWRKACAEFKRGRRGYPTDQQH